MKHPFSLKTLRKDLKKCTCPSKKRRRFRFGNNVGKKLIISTGDISDVDGFYALMEYAKTDADVLFIMNYPGYVEGSHESGYGLGFNFNNQDIKKRDRDKIQKEISDPTFDPNLNVPPRTHYDKIMDKYTLKQAMTNMAFYIVNKIWKEANGKGTLYFMIGGVNKSITFGLNAHKNEVRVYSDVTYPFFQNVQNIIPDIEGKVYIDINNSKKHISNFNLNNYNSIYIDFNGSMSFLKSKIKTELQTAIDNGKVKGVFVMGGVYAFEPPKTMPSIPGVLNRLSSATMNQLYHPEYTGNFFEMVNGKVPIYVVTNNEVGFIDQTFSQSNFKNFMKHNNIHGNLIVELADLFYTEIKSPYKPFDYYVAKALVENMNGHLKCEGNTGNLFYNNKYGITLYSKNSQDAKSVLTEYSKSIGDLKGTDLRSTGLTKEQNDIYNPGKLPMISLPVINLKCQMDQGTKHITIKCDKS